MVQINLSTCCACLKEVVSLWPFYIMTSINNNMMQCCPNHFGMQMSKWRSKFKYNLTSCLIGWFNKTFFCQPYCHSLKFYIPCVATLAFCISIATIYIPCVAFQFLSITQYNIYNSFCVFLSFSCYFSFSCVQHEQYEEKSLLCPCYSVHTCYT